MSPSRGEFANQCSTLATGRNKTRADGWRGVLMDMAWTMHSRGVRGLTMKTFRMKSARQRNRASAAKGVGSFIAWAALSIIAGPETGLEGGGSPSPSIGY